MSKGKIPKIDKLTARINELKGVSPSPQKVSSIFAPPISDQNNSQAKTIIKSFPANKVFDKEFKSPRTILHDEALISHLEEELAIAIKKGKIPRVDKLTARINELKGVSTSSLPLHLPSKIAPPLSPSPPSHTFSSVGVIKESQVKGRSLNNEEEIAQLEEELKVIIIISLFL